MATAHKVPDEPSLPTGMTVDTFLPWYESHQGRYELHNGSVYAMSPERIGHVRAKSSVLVALTRAIEAAGSQCEAVGDGIAVHVSDTQWYEPDAVVYCGETIANERTDVPNPVIVVEVVSPSTVRLDEGTKMLGYLSLASLQHYLIVYPEERRIILHERQPDGRFMTTLIGGGSMRLEPPGLDINFNDILP